MIDTEVFAKLPSIIPGDQSYLQWQAECLQVFRNHMYEKDPPSDSFDMVWFSSVDKIIALLRENDGGITGSEVQGYRDAMEFLDIINEGA
jgi:hypothetical protein